MQFVLEILVFFITVIFAIFGVAFVLVSPILLNNVAKIITKFGGRAFPSVTIFFPVSRFLLTGAHRCSQG